MSPARKFVIYSRPFVIHYAKSLLLLIFSFGLTCGYAAAQSDSVGPVLYASEANVKVGNWVPVVDPTAAGGVRLSNPDEDNPKILEPLADPAHYFELTFDAEANRPYHLWIRAKTESNSTYNDSVYVQFSGTIDSGGQPIYRSGTTSATIVILEDCKGCGVSGWGWQDNGRDVPGDSLYFERSGPQTIRIQSREDGISIDQIVLSPQTYLNTAPGALSNDTTIISRLISSDSALLKVLDWNISKGRGTDNIEDIERTATYIARYNPDVILACEVMRTGSDNQPQLLADKLEQKLGGTWYYHWYGKYSGDDEGNLILSRYPLQNKSGTYFSYQRSVAHAAITVNSRTINLFATHLDNTSSSLRRTQVNQLEDYLSDFGEDKVVGGDFNATRTTSEIMDMKSDYYDSWELAFADQTATAYADNPVSLSTNTRRSRIDFIFFSQKASHLNVKSAQIPDTRDLKDKNVQYKLGTSDDKGVRPSDHNPTITVFNVN